jgi:RimJ/RimL family protein N-acetyltransferase
MRNSIPSSGHPEVSLRTLVRDDADAWYACLMQPGVLAHTSWQLSSVDDLAPVFDALEETSTPTQIRMAVVDRAGALVGSIGFHRIQWPHGTAEIAYELCPAYWGRGIASALCLSVSQWALAAFGWHRIQACVVDSNAASAAVLRRCGFQHEGRLRHFRQVRGVARDFDVYGLISADGGVASG